MDVTLPIVQGAMLIVLLTDHPDWKSRTKVNKLQLLFFSCLLATPIVNAIYFMLVNP
jgi:hypothetical protein